MHNPTLIVKILVALGKQHLYSMVLLWLSNKDGGGFLPNGQRHQLKNKHGLIPFP